MSEITKSAIFYSMMIITINAALALSVMGQDILLR